jgi:hypothetical protein
MVIGLGWILILFALTDIFFTFSPRFFTIFYNKEDGEFMRTLDPSLRTLLPVYAGETGKK